MLFGCIGYGFVGNALCECLQKNNEIIVYDVIDISSRIKENYTIKFEKEFHKFVELLECDTDTPPIYFVCVPTPMKQNEKICDTTIIDSVLEKLYKTISKKSCVVIKSTIPVGKTQCYTEKYNDKLCVIFNPEFLTQSNAVNDFKAQTHAILGVGDNQISATNKLFIDTISKIYTDCIDGIEICICTSKEAEMCKLMLNSFWATKVAFANEMHDICESLGVDYKSVADLAKRDPRLGKTHLDVPGFDGYRGFGGVCLPKDLNNLKTIANKNGVRTTILDAVWEKNCEVREDFDWEKLIGKAVSREN